MISDALTEALAKIEECERATPHGATTARVAIVKGFMRALLVDLSATRTGTSITYKLGSKKVQQNGFTPDGEARFFLETAWRFAAEGLDAAFAAEMQRYLDASIQPRDP